MIVRTLPLLFCMRFVCGYNEEVDFFSLCGDEIGHDKEVTGLLTVKIDGRSWIGDADSCTVVFKSYRGASDLYYRFSSFDLGDSENKIEIKSKKLVNRYTEEATYNYNNSPVIGIAKLTSRYLKVSCTRGSDPTVYTRPISAVFEVYLEGFSVPPKKSVLNITAIIAGMISLLLFLILMGVCYRRYQSKRTNRGAAIQNSNRQVTATTTSATSPGYGLDQFSMHPVHPPAQSRPGYPDSPPAYQPAQNMGYSDDPPSYDAVVNGDANFKNYT